MPTYVTRKAGIYRATYAGCTERELVNQDTGEMERRWLWRFQELTDPTTAGEISKWTGTSLKSPKSNAHIMAAGVMGRKLQPDDDTETMVGQTYDVVYGPNQAGNLTITSVVRVSDAPAQAAVDPSPQPAAATPAGAPPELP